MRDLRGLLTLPEANLADFYRELGHLFEAALPPHNRQNIVRPGSRLASCFRRKGGPVGVASIHYAFARWLAGANSRSFSLCAPVA